MDEYPLEPLWSYFRDPQSYFSLCPKDILAYCLLPYLAGNVGLFDSLTWISPQLVATIQLPEVLKGRGSAHILMFLRNGDVLLLGGGMVSRYSLKKREIVWTLPKMQIESLYNSVQLDYLIVTVWSNPEGPYTCWLISCISEQMAVPSLTPITRQEYDHLLQSGSAQHWGSGIAEEKFRLAFAPLSIVTPDGSPFQQASDEFNRGYVFQTISSADHHWIRIYRAIQ